MKDRSLRLAEGASDSLFYSAAAFASVVRIESLFFLFLWIVDCACVFVVFCFFLFVRCTHFNCALFQCAYVWLCSNVHVFRFVRILEGLSPFAGVAHHFSTASLLLSLSTLVSAVVMIVVRRTRFCMQKVELARRATSAESADSVGSEHELHFLLPQLGALELDPGLSFAELCRTPPRSTRAHVYMILPQLSVLITHPNAELREHVALLIGQIATDFLS
jgi:hypothetical protein